jgi:adenylate cyclase
MTITEVIRRLASLGASPEDDAEERLRKAVLTLFASLVAALALVWVGSYLAAGLPVPAMIPLAYQAGAILGLVYLARTKRLRGVQLSQLWLILLLPPLLQWSLGGFVTGSAVIMWSFTAPLGALLFLGRREAVPWFLAFIGLVAVSGVLEVVARRPVVVPRPLSVTFFALNIVGPAVATFMMLRYFVGERDRERLRSERLLLNVLPAPIAERLKEDGGVIADAHAEVTVVFADLVAFTPLAERMPAEDTVSVLDRIFSAFDRLADRWGLEKIKTIGDAYMVASGLPEPRPDHAEAAAGMALDMLEETARCEEELGLPLTVRIGMESGPVVAGVIGRRKFIYDLWGDTVNTASRMESHGVPGAIQVGPKAHALLRDRHRFTERESIEVKGKGVMTTYLLTR